MLQLLYTNISFSIIQLFCAKKNPAPFCVCASCLPPFDVVHRPVFVVNVYLCNPIIHEIVDVHLCGYLVVIGLVGKAVVFSTSWLSKHALDLIKNALKDKGIQVEDSTLYFKSKAVDGCRSEVIDFTKKFI